MFVHSQRFIFRNFRASAIPAILPYIVVLNRYRQNDTGSFKRYLRPT